MHSPPELILTNHLTVSDLNLNGSGCSRQTPPAGAAIGHDTRKTVATSLRTVWIKLAPRCIKTDSNVPHVRRRRNCRTFCRQKDPVQSREPDRRQYLTRKDTRAVRRIKEIRNQRNCSASHFAQAVAQFFS